MISSTVAVDPDGTLCGTPAVCGDAGSLAAYFRGSFYGRVWCVSVAGIGVMEGRRSRRPGGEATAPPLNNGVGDEYFEQFREVDLGGSPFGVAGDFAGALGCVVEQYK